MVLPFLLTSAIIVHFDLIEYKAWINVKSPRFFIWKAIQYIEVIVSGVKTLVPPTYSPLG